jgi:hypothetical protein
LDVRQTGTTLARSSPPSRTAAAESRAGGTSPILRCGIAKSSHSSNVLESCASTNAGADAAAYTTSRTSTIGGGFRASTRPGPRRAPGGR